MVQAEAVRRKCFDSGCRSKGEVPQSTQIDNKPSQEEVP